MLLNPQFEFVREPYGFTVRFHRHCGEGWNQEQKNNQSATDTLNGTLSHSEKLKNLIRSNPKTTRKKMAEALGISERSVQRILNEMPNVKFTGGGRSGHWVIEDDGKN